MEFPFDPGALLASTYLLPDGTRVRLRLVAASDLARIAELLAAHGREPAHLEALRLSRFDPRQRLVLCATVLTDGTDRLVGLGAIHLAPNEAGGPDELIVEAGAPDGVAALLSGALVGRARALARRHAA